MFLIKSTLFGHAVYIRHLVHSRHWDSSAANQEGVIGINSEVPLAAYAHQNKATLMTQNSLKCDHKSAK